VCRKPGALAAVFFNYNFAQEPLMAKAKDPVCKMEVDEQKAAGQSEHKGHMYFFCSKVCKQKFDQDPDHYTAA
jgi:YHS domain-containing protein